LVLAAVSEEGCGLGFKCSEGKFDITGCILGVPFLLLDIKFRVISLVFTVMDGVTGSYVALHSFEVDRIFCLTVE
jgi:hypothetical protein